MTLDHAGTYVQPSSHALARTRLRLPVPFARSSVVRDVYLGVPISQALSAKLLGTARRIPPRFPLPWTVWAAYSGTMKAAEKNGNVVETRAHVEELVDGEAPGGVVGRILERELRL